MSPAGAYLLRVNNWGTRTRCEICSKLTIKTRVFIVNFEHISHLALGFLLLALGMWLPAWGLSGCWGLRDMGSGGWFRGVCAGFGVGCVSSGNVARAIVGEFAKWGREGFSVQCFTADFLPYSALSVRLVSCLAGWVPAVNSRDFKDFL